ncbi:Thiol-disulfide oxidoreductase LTO1 [Sesamum angolense]|uniref:Thiol-disulfide oxidoreductase LTO1 n=1 Tax=Sesamum angolense TaxID=2727404 RepID=A0AAE2C621_9LAMI|nr:Thiol-disulfide oxidoreductase LTO1 [Sesamum angolense]
MTPTSFFCISSSSLPFCRTPILSSPFSTYTLSAPSLPRIKKGFSGNEHLLVKVNCVSERSKQTAETESETSSSDTPSSSDSVEGSSDTGISAYKWCVGLGGIGFLETAYLTYLKLTNSDAFCPTGGASCTTILTSDYSSVFGVPLPLFGMLAYGLVTVLGLQLGAKEKTFDIGKTDGEIILIGITTSMAVASAYFLYILNTEFVGELCIYCLASAVLSFSLFFITQKRFGSHDLQKLLGLQLSVAGLVVLALTASYNSVQPISSSLDAPLPFGFLISDSWMICVTQIKLMELKGSAIVYAVHDLVLKEIASKSSPSAISLAKHLRAIGAKLYGAFWCSHCQDQKEISAVVPFPHYLWARSSKLLDYVECFPDGVSKGTKMAQACVDVNLEGFPTWIINGQVLSGEKQLSELAALSGVKLDDLNRSN